MFRPFTLKYLNSLTSIDIISWLGVRELTHPTGMWEVLGSVPGFGKAFYVCFFVSFLLCFTCLSKTYYLTYNFAIPFAMLIHVEHLTYGKCVKNYKIPSYRPSILTVLKFLPTIWFLTTYCLNCLQFSRRSVSHHALFKVSLQTHQALVGL